MRTTLLTVLLLSALVSAQEIEPTEAPFLWRVEGAEDQTPSYLYGTIHVPDERVLALPDSVEEALEAATALYTELPMDMKTQMEMVGKLQLGEGQTLKDVLPPELYKRTEKFITALGFPMMGFNGFKIWAVQMTLSQLEQIKKAMEDGGGGAAGVQALDAVLYARAQGEGKEVGGLETIDEQVGIFDSASQEDQILALETTLDQLEAGEEGEDPLEELIQVYLAGELDALVAMLEADELGSDDPKMVEFREALITKRNILMAERMAEHMAANPETAYFFAVGCLHYPGEEGILALLREAGYTVTRVQPPVAVPAPE